MCIHHFTAIRKANECISNLISYKVNNSLPEGNDSYHTSIANAKNSIAYYKLTAYRLVASCHSALAYTFVVQFFHKAEKIKLLCKSLNRSTVTLQNLLSDNQNVTNHNSVIVELLRSMTQKLRNKLKEFLLLVSSEIISGDSGRQQDPIHTTSLSSTPGNRPGNSRSASGTPGSVRSTGGSGANSPRSPSSSPKRMGQTYHLDSSVFGDAFDQHHT
jgi:hypothetical protein